jgi:hypothetical protein
MINDFWLALRLIPKPKMDLLKRMFSFQGFSQGLNKLKRPLVIQFLVDLIPYLVCFSIIIYSTDTSLFTDSRCSETMLHAALFASVTHPSLGITSWPVYLAPATALTTNVTILC